MRSPAGRDEHLTAAPLPFQNVVPMEDSAVSLAEKSSAAK